MKLLMQTNNWAKLQNVWFSIFQINLCFLVIYQQLL